MSWQIVAEERGARLVPIPIDGGGDLDLDALAKLFSKRTKLVAVSHISNSLGTVVPVAEICALAREHGVPVVVDGAQAVPHERVDVQALGCDFYAFSGHKVFAPNGIGVLWGKAEHLQGDAASRGRRRHDPDGRRSKRRRSPSRPSASRPGLRTSRASIGLGAALTWLAALRGAGAASAPYASVLAGGAPGALAAPAASLAAHESSLLSDAIDKLRAIPGLRIIGSPKHRSSLVSFVLDGIHPHDVGTVLDAEGVAVRAGHHCAQPVMERFGVPATIRASFGPYSQPSDVDALVAALHKAREHLRTGPCLVNDLRELYQEVLLDHYRRPRNFGALEHRDRHGRRPQSAVRRSHHALSRRRRRRGPPGVVRGLRLRDLDRLGVASDRGGHRQDQGEIDRLYHRFHGMVTDDPNEGDPAVDLGKLEIFSGVREYPMRVKCATLSWHALRSGLEGGGSSLR